MKFSESGANFYGMKFAIFCALSAVLVYPIAFLVFLPLSIYRLIIKWLVKVTYPNYGEMLTGMSSVLVAPDPYENPLISVVIFVLYSEKLDINRVKTIVNERIIKPNLYPELKQRIVNKFGYPFWKNVDNFNLDNHVRYLQPECPDKPVLKTELRSESGDKMVFGGFDKRYSPWEIVVVPNVFDPDNPEVKSALYFRVNHCLMDGMSIMKFVHKTASKPWNWPLAKTMSTKANKFSMQFFTSALKLILTGPFLAIRTMALQNDTSEFLNKALEMPENGHEVWAPRNLHEPRRKDLEALRKIRKKLNVGMSSVVTGVVIASVAKFIKKHCNSGFSKLPETFVTHFVVPLPGHPEKMSNHWSCARMFINLNDCQDPVKLVKQIQAEFQKLSKSVVAIVNHLIFSTIAILPVGLRPDPNKPAFQQTLMFTNFPGPSDVSDAFGYKLLAWNVLGSAPLGTALVTGAQTFEGKLTIDAGGVKTLFKNQEYYELFENCVYSVLEQLENSAEVKNGN